MPVQASSLVCLTLLSFASLFYTPLLAFFLCLDILILAAVSKLTRNYQGSLSPPLCGRVVLTQIELTACFSEDYTGPRFLKIK